MSIPQGTRPNFWISSQDQEFPINQALIRAAEEIWPRAHQMVRNALHDGSGAAEFLERVVHEIAASQRRGSLPAELNSPKSLLLTRLYQRLINEIRRNRRVSYIGTLQDLDSLYGSRDELKHIVVREIYRKILVAQLLGLMDADSRRLFMLRLLDYKWSEIGKVLEQRPGTVRERFRVALKSLGERLRTRTLNGSGESE